MNKNPGDVNARCAFVHPISNTQKSAPQSERAEGHLPPPTPRIGAWEHCSASLRAGIRCRARPDGDRKVTCFALFPCFFVSFRTKRTRTMSPPGESLRTDPAERANRQWKRAAVAVATGQMQPIDALQKQGLAETNVELTTLRRHTTNLKKTFKAWADAWAEKPETGRKAR